MGVVIFARHRVLSGAVRRGGKPERFRGGEPDAGVHQHRARVGALGLLRHLHRAAAQVQHPQPRRPQHTARRPRLRPRPPRGIHARPEQDLRKRRISGVHVDDVDRGVPARARGLPGGGRDALRRQHLKVLRHGPLPHRLQLGIGAPVRQSIVHRLRLWKHHSGGGHNDVLQAPAPFPRRCLLLVLRCFRRPEVGPFCRRLPTRCSRAHRPADAADPAPVLFFVRTVPFLT
mmetsp:Transcript_36761/g.76764  ORF Transcript_36761/g.76764 Transcript_36761/m.76764 type:complete len:231 (+) Transcript_36761:582-1274(+)